MFQMCLGAIVFLMLGRMLGMHTAFMIAAATVLAIAARLPSACANRTLSGPPGAEATFRSLIEAVHGRGSRHDSGASAPIFIASLLLQLTFQTLHDVVRAARH